MVYIIVTLISGMLFSISYAMEKPERPSLEKKNNIFIKEASKSDPTKATPRRFSLPIIPSKSSPPESPSQSPNASPRKEIIKVSAPRKSAKGDNQISLDEWFSYTLWNAVENNEDEKALTLLKPNLNIKDSYGKTLLIMAVKNQKINIIQGLLQHPNVDVNLYDKLGNTPLHRAVLVKSEELIYLLLEHFRINSLIKNNNGLLAYEYTEDKFYEDKIALKASFAMRVDLENNVDKEVEALQLMGLKSDDCNLYNEHISSSLSIIKEKCGIFLPQYAYASDDFIRSMILYRLKLKNNEHSMPVFSLTT